MRVWPGDILQLAELEGLAVVVSVDRDNGKIYTDKGCCYIPDIIKWPWELGQKGGGMKIMPLTPCQKARVAYWKAYKRLAEFRREYADYECLCYMPWRHELRSAP